MSWHNRCSCLHCFCCRTLIFKSHCSHACLSSSEESELGERASADAREQALRRLWVEFRSWCRDHKQSAPRGGFTLVNIGADKAQEYPTLSSKYKAATVRHMLPFLASKVISMSESQPTYTLAATCVYSLYKFHYATAHADPIMSQESANDAHASMHAFLKCYAQLHVTARTAGQHRWQARPKLHFLWHISDTMKRTRINPKLSSCWEDESFMGKIKRLAKACHGSSVMLRATQRYIALVAVRWHARLQRVDRVDA